MQLTIEISDALLEDARQIALHDGITLSELVEQGLRLALHKDRKAAGFKLRDASVDGRGLQAGARDLSWPELPELVDRPHHSRSCAATRRGRRLGAWAIDGLS
jgi:hypothetical protein